MQTFPEITKEILGQDLYRVQIGKTPLDWRPMSDIGPGVRELRAHNPDEYRLLYIANYPEAVYVLHAFAKDTKTTTERDKKLGRKRYVELQARRKI